MRLLLRSVLIATYPPIVLSALMLTGMIFGGAFVANFTVENRTDQHLHITPISTQGEGHKAALPTLMVQMPAIPALHGGRFPLGPRESVSILYDMDDINLSEIMIEDERGSLRQLVTDPEPSKNPYRGPVRSHFILDHLESLPPAGPAVVRAAGSARRRESVAAFSWLLLFAPWLANRVLRTSLSRYDRGNAGGPTRAA